MDLTMSAQITQMTPEFIMRLAIAGVLGAVIGLDREYRAKEAGIRTHFLVAIGSALIMIASQWGFADILRVEYAGELKLDPGRMAAQIVSGIGFIGAGTIMMHKQFVRGLTTAAGLWAVAGIGIAIGGGLYIIGCTAAAFTLIGLEAFHYLTRSIKKKCSLVVFSTRNKNDLINVTNELNRSGYGIISCSTDQFKNDPDRIKVQLNVRERDSDDETQLMLFMQQFDGITVEKIE